MDHTHPLVTGELERIKRADAPLRERSRCLTLVRTKVSYRTLHPEHLPQVLPLSDPCLSLTLPAGGGGAWVARLAFWAHLWSPDRDGLGPLVVRAHTWTLQKALSRSFSRSVWYAWSTAIVCNEATIWPAAAYALPFKQDSGLRWQGGSLERGCLAHSEISWLSSLAQGASPHSHFHAPQCQHN